MAGQPAFGHAGVVAVMAVKVRKWSCTRRMDGDGRQSCMVLYVAFDYGEARSGEVAQ